MNVSYMVKVLVEMIEAKRKPTLPGRHRKR